jgi:hypothetical protein
VLPLRQLRLDLGLLVSPTLTAQRAHGRRRRALHSLSLALARHPRIVACARLVARARRDRLARIAVSRELVRRLSAAVAARPRPAGARLRDGDVAAALLSAILRAAGERATVEYTREMPLVRVAVTLGDVRRLPPWARLVRTTSGGLEVAIAPDERWIAATYLPPDVRGALDLRRGPESRTALAS